MAGVRVGCTSIKKAFSDFQKKYDIEGFLQVAEPIGGLGTVREREDRWNKWSHNLHRVSRLSTRLFIGGLQDGHLTALYKIRGEPEAHVEQHLWADGGELSRSLYIEHTPIEVLLHPPDALLPKGAVLYLEDAQLRAFTAHHLPRPAIETYLSYPDNGPRIQFAQVLACLWQDVDEPLLADEYSTCIYEKFLPSLGSKGRLSVNATDTRTGNRVTITKDNWVGKKICAIDGDVLTLDNKMEFTDCAFHIDQIESLVDECEIELAKSWLAGPPATRWQLSYKHKQWLEDQANRIAPQPEAVLIDDELPAEAHSEDVSIYDSRLSVGSTLRSVNTKREWTPDMSGLSDKDQGKVSALREISKYLDKYHPTFPLLKPGEAVERIAKNIGRELPVLNGIYAPNTVRDILRGKNDKAKSLANAGYVRAFWVTHNG